MANIEMSHLLIGSNNLEIVDAVARNGIGAPAVASTVAEMTYTSKVYVYTGSESGYTAGNWYYYNGSAWVSGGVYNSTAFETDDTLSVEGMAADAKAVGDALADVNADLAEKANVDGAYENMTVGNAEQLVSTLYNTDKVPYIFRTSGGSADIGNRENLKKIVGGSVVWNQLLRNGNFANGTTGWTGQSATLTVTDGVARTTFTGSAYNNDLRQTSALRIKDHVYLLSSENRASTALKIYYRNPGGSESSAAPLTTEWRRNEIILKLTSVNPGGGGFGITLVGSGVSLSGEWYETKNFNCFDLTQMFGSTIADYLYTIEQSQAGAGIAKLKSWGYLTEDYYEYDPGTMQSVEGLSSHDTVGFNAYDPNTGKAEVLGGNQYQITGTFTSLSLDGTTITPDSNGLFTPDHNGTLTVTGGGADTCVHLTWSGSRNGDYEPYVKHSYPLDPTVTLRGIPQLDANGNLYYDGDEYEPDGTVTRRYKEVTFDGTENWGKEEDSWNPNANVYYVSIAQNNGIQADNMIIPNMVATDFVATYYLDFRRTADNNKITLTSNGAYIEVTHSAADVASFKSWLSANPFTVVYELAEPTTDQADPYQETQIVDDFGTEEFVTSGIVPVGHVTEYMANLRDKLQHLPDLASADGDYAVRQTGSQMALVPLEQVKELPDAPTDDGTYTLIATVSNGVVTLSWRS